MHDPHHKRYWISYDIGNDHRRHQLSQLLTGWGVRVQFSAFECVLNAHEIKKLQRQIKRLINPQQDQVVILQCAAPGRPTHPLLGRAHDHAHNYWIS